MPWEGTFHHIIIVSYPGQDKRLNGNGRISLKDYSKNRPVDGTQSRQDLLPQLLLVSRQYRQALKIQQKSSFSPSSPKTVSPCSTTEVIPRFSPTLPKRPHQHQRRRRAHFTN
ncbi:hypothetical protein TNCV_3605221 [Trichonephila clavipes]|uniref:Uncharacterized protein n=1 Tax=Trichonephila clavipes TaxID=2585209 RepID=A0A8X6RHE6_TRICX|nr:hypothetical protein TNCV_3605221 [Trichonephila clavipes]